MGKVSYVSKCKQSRENRSIVQNKNQKIERNRNEKMLQKPPREK